MFRLTFTSDRLVATRIAHIIQLVIRKLLKSNTKYEFIAKCMWRGQSIRRFAGELHELAHANSFNYKWEKSTAVVDKFNGCCSGARGVCAICIVLLISGNNYAYAALHLSVLIQTHRHTSLNT